MHERLEEYAPPMGKRLTASQLRQNIYRILDQVTPSSEKKDGS